MVSNIKVFSCGNLVDLATDLGIVVSSHLYRRLKFWKEVMQDVGILIYMLLCTFEALERKYLRKFHSNTISFLEWILFWAVNFNKTDDGIFFKLFEIHLKKLNHLEILLKNSNKGCNFYKTLNILLFIFSFSVFMLNIL